MYNRVFVVSILLLLPSFLYARQDPEIKMADVDGSTLQEAFTHIEKHTNYTIAYSLSKINPDAHVDISDSADVTLDKAMSEILKGTGCSYIINGNHIILVAEVDNWETAIAATTSMIDEDFAREVHRKANPDGTEEAVHDYATKTIFLDVHDNIISEEMKRERQLRYMPDDNSLLVEHISNKAAIIVKDSISQDNNYGEFGKKPLFSFIKDNKTE